MIGYTVKKSHKEDTNFDTIEKTGITHEFTIQDILEEEEKYEKMVKEIEANMEVKGAIKTNVTGNNPWITKMEEEKIHACHMYWEAHAYVKGGETKVNEIKRALKASKKERKDIKTQAYGK